MPEGPEIRRAADAVEAAIGGQIIRDIYFGLPRLKVWQGRLVGRRVLAVETRGKAMLTHLSKGLTIYSHNQLYGRWYCVKAGEHPDTRRQLRLGIYTAGSSALLYSASDILVLEDAELATHPLLKKLGPDVLAEETTVDRLVGRLKSGEWRGRQTGAILTNQSLVAGLGNYLRCEILFMTGIHPRQRVKDLDEVTIRKLAAQMLELPRQSYRTGGITNDEAKAQALMRQGGAFEDSRFRVYRRQGLPCYRCGAAIVREDVGGQHCYRCPQCQAMSSGSDAPG